MFGETLSSPIVAAPKEGHTATFLSVGAYKTQFEAKAVFKYLHTKFLRALMGIVKVTQNTTRDVFQFVPLQHFTSHSDIDWSKSIPDIDQQLYRKYNLSPDETAFIEKMIKPME